MLHRLWSSPIPSGWSMSTIRNADSECPCTQTKEELPGPITNQASPAPSPSPMGAPSKPEAARRRTQKQTQLYWQLKRWVSSTERPLSLYISSILSPNLSLSLSLSPNLSLSERSTQCGVSLFSSHRMYNLQLLARTNTGYIAYVQTPKPQFKTNPSASPFASDGCLHSKLYMYFITFYKGTLFIVKLDLFSSSGKTGSASSPDRLDKTSG